MQYIRHSVAESSVGWREAGRGREGKDKITSPKSQSPEGLALELLSVTIRPLAAGS